MAGSFKWVRWLHLACSGSQTQYNAGSDSSRLLMHRASHNVININNRIEKSHCMVGRCEQSDVNFKLLRLIKYFIETLEGISFIFISTFMCSKAIIFGGS